MIETGCACCDSICGCACHWEDEEDEGFQCSGCNKWKNLYNEPAYPVQGETGSKFYCKECVCVITL